MRPGHTLPIALVLACTTSQPASTKAGPPPPPPVVAPTPAQVPEIGIWHMAEPGDPTNLEIDGYGFFEWDINGCDYGAKGGGKWHADPSGGIVLEPTSGTTFQWMTRHTFDDPAMTLKARGGGQQIAITGTFANGQPVDQVWQAGAVCPTCGREGPVRTKACPRNVRRP